MNTEHSVAKLLDGGEEGRDWRALGNLLGYKEVPSLFYRDGDEKMINQLQQKVIFYNLGEDGGVW